MNKKQSFSYKIKNTENIYKSIFSDLIFCIYLFLIQPTSRTHWYSERVIRKKIKSVAKNPKHLVFRRNGILKKKAGVRTHILFIFSKWIGHIYNKIMKFFIC